MPDARDFIDLESYPIDRPGKDRDELLVRVRTSLETDGCAVLKKFLAPAGIVALTREANSVSHLGHRSYNRTNPYFTVDDPTLPKDDPRRAFFDRSIISFPQTILRLMGRCEGFMTFTPLIRLSVIACSRKSSTAMKIRLQM